MDLAWSVACKTLGSIPRYGRQQRELVVGDAAGHGIHAAATMGRPRTAVKTLADIDLEPGELLTRLDDVVTAWPMRQSVRFAAIADWADSDAYPVSFMCAALDIAIAAHKSTAGVIFQEVAGKDKNLLRQHRIGCPWLVRGSRQAWDRSE